MRGAVLASVLLGAAACGQPAIEVHLDVPGEPVPPMTFDYSCIGAVDVLPIPPGYMADYDIGQVYFNPGEPVAPTCIDLPRAPTSMADLRGLLHGQLDIAIPPGGLQAMELRVRPGHCDQGDWFHEANIYGGGVYTGGNQLTITLSHNLSCDWSTSYTFRPVDVLAMTADHKCDPMTSGQVYVGDIRPTNFGIPTMEETGGMFVELGPTVSTVKLPTYSRSYQRTCLVAGYADAMNDTNSCINPNAPHLCDATDFDVPFVSSAFLSNAETATAPLVTGDYQRPVLVTVVQDQAGQKVAIAGATVTIPSANAGSGQPPQTAQSQIVFGDPSDASSQTFTPNTTTQVTTASGMFMAYLNGVTAIDVSAPGPNGTTLHGSTFIGPDPFEPTSALIVVQ